LFALDVCRIAVRGTLLGFHRLLLSTFGEMMDKKSALKAIRTASAAHIKWRAYANAMIAGVSVEEGKVPVMHTDCVFGKWYYGEGRANLFY
jgi:hypothetical protein